VNLRKALTNKFGSLTTVFAFSVLLGGFDRKLMIRPILTSTIPPSASLAKQEEAEVQSVSPPQLFSSNRSRHRNRMKPLNRESKMLSDIMSLLILQKMLKLGLKLQGFLCGPWHSRSKGVLNHFPREANWVMGQLISNPWKLFHFHSFINLFFILLRSLIAPLLPPQTSMKPWNNNHSHRLHAQRLQQKFEGIGKGQWNQIKERSLISQWPFIHESNPQAMVWQMSQGIDGNKRNKSTQQLRHPRVNIDRNLHQGTQQQLIAQPSPLDFGCILEIVDLWLKFRNTTTTLRQFRISIRSPSWNSTFRGMGPWLALWVQGMMLEHSVPLWGNIKAMVCASCFS
jgi:hypothetical protein